MRKYTATEEPIVNYYKWMDLQPKMQQYVIDHKEAAEGVINEVLAQCRLN